MNGGSTRSVRRAGSISTLLGIVVGGAAMVFVVGEMTESWDRVANSIVHASLGWASVSVVLALVAMILLSWGWGNVLDALGASAPRRQVMAWFFVGELGKYVPGGVWSVLGRGELAARGGVGRANGYTSVAFSLAAAYLAAMIAALGFMPFALGGDGPSVWAIVLALAPLGLMALHPRVLNVVLSLARRVSRRSINVVIPPWKTTVSVVLQYLPSWVATGLCSAALAHAIAPGEGIGLRVVFAALLSWVSGFVAVPVPAGAGVREATFVAASGLPAELAATVAVAARLIFVFTDVGGAVIGGAYLRRAKAGAPDDRAPAPA